jgi:hypothetical protein
MKSVHTGWKIPNMRGKKVYRFRCQCCEAIDFRDEQEAREATRLVTAAKRGLLTQHYLHQAEIDAA